MDVKVRKYGPSLTFGQRSSSLLKIEICQHKQLKEGSRIMWLQSPLENIDCLENTEITDTGITNQRDTAEEAWAFSSKACILEISEIRAWGTT